MGALVPILKNVSDPGLTDELVQLVAVGAHERIVLFDHELGIAGGARQVLDEGGEARGAGRQIGPVVPPGVVDRGLDLRFHQGCDDPGPVPWSLVHHVQPPVAWLDQTPDHPTDLGLVGHCHSGQDVPGPLRLVDVNPRRHLPTGRPRSWRGPPSASSSSGRTPVSTTTFTSREQTVLR